MNMNSTHIHQQLAKLINATESLSVFVDQAIDTMLQGKQLSNYYLALHDIESQTLSLPYTHGRSEIEKSCTLHSVNSPIKRVIQSQEALVIKTEDYLKLCDDGSRISNPPMLWIGLPLAKGSDVFGVLVFTAFDKSQLGELEATESLLKPFPELLSPYLLTKIRLTNLEESEQRFRRFVETSIDITFQVNTDGILDYVSSNIETRFGIDPKALLGRNITTLTTENQGPLLKKGMKTISEGKTIRNLTVNIQRSAGEIIPMEVSARPIVVGDKIVGAQGTVRDISERNRAQQEIERLAFFPLANPMPVVEVDLNGVPGYINPAGIKLLERMDLDMSQVSQILPKTFKADITVARSVKGQIPSREVSLEGMHLLWSAFFLQNQNLLHYYATDITNLKNTEMELISAKEQALKNEEVKTLFLANMSHEIRTPLNSILGFTELIEEEVKDKFDEHLEAYFDTIYMSGKRLWQTVHHILDISQIETGTFELKTESVDLGKIITDLGASFNSVAKAKDLELKINVPDMDLHVISDEYCATQAISNLIDNAIKYTNSGYVSLEINVVGDSVKITIKDTGIGMSREYQDMIFEVFSQESTGYTKNFQGMGLGLALAHRYLSLINGKLHLESEQDKGSMFTIIFPGMDPATTEEVIEPVLVEPEVKSLDEASDTRINILVVEDDPNSQKLASFTLSKDYDLHFAESVADSKKMLDAHEVQMILLDLSLRGDEDGLDLARFLRNEEKWNKIPIVALTAHAFTSDRDRCMEAGCSDFMTKPFRLAELKETIQRLI